MKVFLIRSIIFFLIAAAITILLFFFVRSYQTDDELTAKALNEIGNNTEMVSRKLSEQIPEEGIPLSALPLNDSHKKALETARIDTESFVLTEPMVTCAGTKVGDERIAEIISGNTPSILELTKLLPCLKA